LVFEDWGNNETIQEKGNDSAFEDWGNYDTIQEKINASVVDNRTINETSLDKKVENNTDKVLVDQINSENKLKSTTFTQSVWNFLKNTIQPDTNLTKNITINNTNIDIRRLSIQYNCQGDLTAAEQAKVDFLKPLWDEMLQLITGNDHSL